MLQYIALARLCAPVVRLRSGTCLAAFLAMGIFLLAAMPAHAQNIIQTATPVLGWPGAVGINLQWQTVSSPTLRPLIQEQGVGGDDLLTEAGYSVSPARVAAVNAAFVQIDWMRQYLASDGSFPGNGNGTRGNNFFDMMNAMASFTRGARAIVQNPAWDALYHAKIMEEVPVWDSVCSWLATPTVKAAGDAYNAPFTHRFWMDATVFRNEAYLLRLLGGTTNLAHADAYDAIALDYENQGLAQQKGLGWMLALYPPFRDGRLRASVLYYPAAGSPIPNYSDGTPSNRHIPGAGVRPELGDGGNRTWDAIYNPNGDKLAVWDIGVQPAGQHRQDCSHAVDMNLMCAMQFLTNKRDNQGTPILITPDGSGRVGSLDINGNPKKIDAKAWRSIFQVQSGLAPDAAIYGGSHSSECRALFAQVFHWLDNAIRNPSATIPAPPAIPASLYPLK